MSRATYGTVEADIDGETYTLKVTLDAIEKIENRWGGMRTVVESCSDLSFDGAAYIIAAACNIGQRELKPLKEAILKEGLINVIPKVTEYVMLLINPTGKDLDDDDVESDDSEGE
jgi:hypothetical protein